MTADIRILDDLEETKPWTARDYELMYERAKALESAEREAREQAQRERDEARWRETVELYWANIPSELRAEWEIVRLGNGSIALEWLEDRDFHVGIEATGIGYVLRPDAGLVSRDADALQWRLALSVALVPRLRARKTKAS